MKNKPIIQVSSVLFFLGFKKSVSLRNIASIAKSDSFGAFSNGACRCMRWNEKVPIINKLPLKHALKKKGTFFLILVASSDHTSNDQ